MTPTELTLQEKLVLFTTEHFKKDKPETLEHLKTEFAKCERLFPKKSRVYYSASVIYFDLLFNKKDFNVIEHTLDNKDVMDLAKKEFTDNLLLIECKVTWFMILFIDYKHDLVFDGKGEIKMLYS